MGYVISENSLGSVWTKSLKLFTTEEVFNRYDSMRGPCIELEDVLLDIKDITREPRIHNLFPSAFIPLVDDFTEKLTQKQSGRVSTLNARLFSWKKRDKKNLNQLSLIISMLKEKPESRYSILGFWDPDLDPESTQPSGVLSSYYRIRSGKLYSTVVIRTVDAWLGAVPAMVGFANLQIYIANQLDVNIGSLNLLALSYHIYEMDLPYVLENIEV